jgi:hypothetical protein
MGVQSGGRDLRATYARASAGVAVPGPRAFICWPKSEERWYGRAATHREAPWLVSLAPRRSALAYTGRFAIWLTAPD